MVTFCLNGFNGSAYLGRSDLPGWIDAAAAAGFPLFTPDRFSLEAWTADGRSLDSLARYMRDAGMGCGSIAASALVGSPGDAADLSFALRAAEAMGASFAQINIGCAGFSAQAAALEQACELAAGTGVRLAIEYMPTTALSTLGDTVALVRHAGGDRAGAMIDIWHHSRGPDDWNVLEAVPLDTIAYVEFCDAFPVTGDDLVEEMVARRTFPGEGEFDTARFASLFLDRGYDGMVSIEVLNSGWRDRPPVEFAQRCLATSAPYWSRG